MTDAPKAEGMPTPSPLMRDEFILRGPMALMQQIELLQAVISDRDAQIAGLKSRGVDRAIPAMKDHRARAEKWLADFWGREDEHPNEVYINSLTAQFHEACRPQDQIDYVMKLAESQKKVDHLTAPAAGVTDTEGLAEQTLQDDAIAERERPFWVVERYINGKLHYWSPGSRGRGNRDDWVNDIEWAIKLATLESSQIALVHGCDGEGRAVLHQFVKV